MNNKQSVFIDPVALREDVSIIAKDVSALKQYLREHPKEPYATPQLIDEELPKSIMVIRTYKGHKESLITVINPQIMERIDKFAVEETQAQVEGTYLNIRHPKILVSYLALPGATPVTITLQGKAAILFQQACHLLQGIPISLLGLRVDNYPEYQNGTEEERMKIVEGYIEALKEIYDQFTEDNEVKDYVAAAEFLSEKMKRSIDEEIKETIEKVKQEEEAVEKVQ
jgi:hypothetical protein